MYFQAYVVCWEVASVMEMIPDYEPYEALDHSIFMAL